MQVLPRLGVVALLALAFLVPAAQAKPAKTFTFLLSLEREQGALDRMALRVSAPASGQRGAYLPLGQIERRFGASAATAGPSRASFAVTAPWAVSAALARWLWPRRPRA